VRRRLAGRLPLRTFGRVDGAADKIERACEPYSGSHTRELPRSEWPSAPLPVSREYVLFSVAIRG